MRHRWMAVTAVGVVGVLVTSARCGRGAGEVEEARERVAVLMNARRDGRLEDLLGCYSPVFFEETSRADWKATLEAQRESLGPLRAWTVKEAFRARDAKEVPGTVVAVTVASRYERREATESLMLFKPHDGTTWSVIGHRIEVGESGQSSNGR